MFLLYVRKKYLRKNKLHFQISPVDQTALKPLWLKEESDANKIVMSFEFDRKIGGKAVPQYFQLCPVLAMPLPPVNAILNIKNKAIFQPQGYTRLTHSTVL